MKKLILVGLLTLTCFGMTACGNNNPNIKESEANASIGGDTYGTYEWVSPDGVHYWIYQGFYKYGMAPRYNSEGNLVIEEGK